MSDQGIDFEYSGKDTSQPVVSEACDLSGINFAELFGSIYSNINKMPEAEQVNLIANFTKKIAEVRSEAKYEN